MKQIMKLIEQDDYLNDRVEKIEEVGSFKTNGHEAKTFLINEKILFSQIVNGNFADNFEDHFLGTITRNIAGFETQEMISIEREQKRIVFMDHQEPTSFHLCRDEELDELCRKYDIKLKKN